MGDERNRDDADTSDPVVLLWKKRFLNVSSPRFSVHVPCRTRTCEEGGVLVTMTIERAARKRSLECRELDCGSGEAQDSGDATVPPQ